MIFKTGAGPRPPAHYGCRSTVVPGVKKEFQIPGLRGERASMTGPVSDKATYNSWLKTQPIDFQNEVLGIEKAKLFRNGGLHLSKFIDDKGVGYSLEKLKKLEPLAFERAGL